MEYAFARCPKLDRLARSAAASRRASLRPELFPDYRPADPWPRFAVVDSKKGKSGSSGRHRGKRRRHGDDDPPEAWEWELEAILYAHEHDDPELMPDYYFARLYSTGGFESYKLEHCRADWEREIKAIVAAHDTGDRKLLPEWYRERLDLRDWDFEADDE